MKKRISGSASPRIVVGLDGALQQDLDLYQGVQAVAREEGWQLIPLREHFESRLTELIQSRAIDGVIASLISETWLEGLPGPLPAMVNVASRSDIPRLSQVWVNCREVGRQVAGHLRETNPEQWVYLGVPGSQACREMEKGFREGMPPDSDCVVSRSQIPGSLIDLLRASEPPLAVMCHSDRQARQLLTAAVAEGFSIPDDLSVVGVGDQELDRLASGIGISSVPVPLERVGFEAALLLKQQFDDPETGSVHRWLSSDRLQIRESSHPDDSQDPLVARAVNLLQRQLSGTVSTEEVAQACGLSRRSLEQRFKKSLGISPYAYLQQMRLETAQVLLRETSLRVRQIGERVGFPDPQRFSSFFKRHTGKSPKSWRA